MQLVGGSGRLHLRQPLSSFHTPRLPESLVDGSAGSGPACRVRSPAGKRDGFDGCGRVIETYLQHLGIHSSVSFDIVSPLGFSFPLICLRCATILESFMDAVETHVSCTNRVLPS